MEGRVNLQFVALAVVQVFFLPRILHAQLPPRIERCVPYPTLAQEIRATQEESGIPPTPRVVIASVQFAPGTHISESVRNQIIWSMESPQFHDDAGRNWLKEMQEVGIQGALRDSGYWKAKLKANARLLGGNERRRRYAVTLHIEEGWQYQLGDVRFEPADPDQSSLVFSVRELRLRVPMGRGELFNASKVRKGIQEITKLYRNNGYIDIVPEPVVLNDNDGGPIDLVIKIDEGKQYRIGHIEFLGLAEDPQNQLKLQLKPGEPYNADLVDEILEQYKSVLPADTYSDRQIARNMQEGVVDIRFDFWSCPKTRN